MKPDPLDCTEPVPDAGLPLAVLELLLKEWLNGRQLEADMRRWDAADGSLL